jgi:hypothetical protein
VHGTDLHGGGRIVRVSKWLTVLLCRSCGSWHESRHRGVLRGMSLSISSPCVSLYSVAKSKCSQDIDKFVAAAFVAGK